jgi:hypothetical protein
LATEERFVITYINSYLGGSSTTPLGILIVKGGVTGGTSSAT